MDDRIEDSRQEKKGQKQGERLPLVGALRNIAGKKPDQLTASEKRKSEILQPMPAQVHQASKRQRKIPRHATVPEQSTGKDADDMARGQEMTTDLLLQRHPRVEEILSRNAAALPAASPYLTTSSLICGVQGPQSRIMQASPHHGAPLNPLLSASLLGGVYSRSSNPPLTPYQRLQYDAALLRQRNIHVQFPQQVLTTGSPSLLPSTASMSGQIVDVASPLGFSANPWHQLQLLARGQQMYPVASGALAGPSSSDSATRTQTNLNTAAGMLQSLPGIAVSQSGIAMPRMPGNDSQQHVKQSLQQAGLAAKGSSTKKKSSLAGGATSSVSPGVSSDPAALDHVRRSKFIEQFRLSQVGNKSKSAVLYRNRDEFVLSGYQCLVRKQIELFEATEDDVQFTISKMSKTVVVRQVGIRCRHCAVLPQYARPKAAIYFPRTLDSMYQFGQNMVKNHLTKTCTMIPAQIKERLIELQEERKRGRGGRERWAEAAQELDVIERNGALFFTEESSGRVAHDESGI